MRTDSTPLIILHWQPGHSQSQPVQWFIVDSQRSGYSFPSLYAALSSAQPDSTIPSVHKHKAVLLLPAETALTTRVVVPSAKPAHIRAAVPHLVEEWTIAENESQHLSIGARGEDHQVAVTTIDRELLNQALAESESPRYTCDAVYVDAALLPYSPNTLTLLIDGERALFRWNAEQAGALDTQSLVPFLSALLRRQLFQAIDILCTVDTPEPAIDHLEQKILTLTKNPPPIHRHAPVASLLQYCADQLTDQPRATNLRQGDFAPPHTESKQWQRWRPVAIAAAICLCVQIGFNVIAGWRFNQQASALHAQSEQIYRELFPGDKRIVNLRQQFQNHLNNGAETNQRSFFELFGVLTKEIQNTTTDKPIQLRSLLYDKKDGTLQVQLIVPSVQTLDDLQKRLSANSLLAKITSAANSEGAVIGQLTLAGKS